MSHQTFSNVYVNKMKPSKYFKIIKFLIVLQTILIYSRDYNYALNLDIN